MPAGDGTGPMWAGMRAPWGGGEWCRGARVRAGFGFGGHGWRHGYHATGLPGWARWGYAGRPWSFDRLDAEQERRDLAWRARELEAELGRIRSRLAELRDDRTGTS